MKEKFLKYWKFGAGILLAGLAVFLGRGRTTTKSDQKVVVDEAVSELKPKTEEAVSAVNEIEKVVGAPTQKYEGRDLDIKKIVEDYEKL